jgi:hypothetical protein
MIIAYKLGATGKLPETVGSLAARSETAQRYRNHAGRNHVMKA